ncbi:MAG TPA: electron transfer flavoprotein subunit beta/FixA family protein [Acidimicrobiia bacterium]|nr:electron transfer flavoprotein subunit beta/FixA family protein [Acidimicrobiia bacterium]
MKVVVCVKQIPDPASEYTLEPDSHWLVRPTEQVLDDTDRYGVEMGLQLAQEAEGGTVTLVSMGPAGNMQGIRQALAMGADKAVVVDDAELRGSDALTTARILAAAIRREGFDLVIAGTESTDGYSGVVPQMVAELLDVPALTYATSVEIAETVTIHRQTMSGYDTVEAALPALVSVTAGVVEPRYPTFKGIMDAKKKPVDTLTVSDLDVDPVIDQKVTEVTPAPERSAGTIVEDDGEGHLAIIAKLRELKVI